MIDTGDDLEQRGVETALGGEDRRELHVLRHQIERKERFEIAIGGMRIVDAGGGIARAHNPRVARRARENVEQHRIVDTRASGKCQRQAECGHVGAGQHVVAEFRGLTSTMAADVDDEGTPGLRDWLEDGVGLVRAADHRAERAGLGADWTAREGTVGDDQVRWLELARELLGERGWAGREIGQHGATG